MGNGEGKASEFLGIIPDYLFSRGRLVEQELVDQTKLGHRSKKFAFEHPDTIRMSASYVATYHEGKFADGQ